ncbi:MAG: NAD-dependent malic enzyme [Proteobacteria bacterium]|nr:NAD-dependent malic enzyme [Pseudomonadota bacterium]
MFNKASSETKGINILKNEFLNKNTAFTLEEREKLGLTGLLPDAVNTIEQQCQRVLGHLSDKDNDLERYIYLTGLLDRNETLFYKVIMSDPARFIPILYDPTVGDACLKFDAIYRRPRGMYVSLRHQGKIEAVLRNWPHKDVRFICVSTGERILGLGDLGANGMGIPIGKLQLYTACAAIPPINLLPVLLDCGTNNKTLLQDPLYLGVRENRPQAPQMDAFVDEFVYAVQKVFPDCCIHFEDWKGLDAIKYLAKYRNKVCCYNDDIQGTASIVLSGLITALRIKKEKLKDQKILFLGAGSAGIGIANLLESAMKLEGLSEKEARERITLFDINGLIEVSRKDLTDSQKIYAKTLASSKDLVQVIKSIKPSVLIGVSTQGKAFTQDVVQTMSALNERPIIFALSNPTDKAECSAEDAYTWSQGKALYAAGVQFPTFNLNGKTFYPGQANNFYIFPAVSLAVFATKPKTIPDALFIRAAQATSDQISEEDSTKGRLFPLQSNILQTEITTAIQVAQLIFDQNLATVERPKDIKAWLEQMLYQPEYTSIQKMLS